MKVLFVTNLPTPYRVNFFNEFNKLVELTAFFETNRHKIRNSNWLDSVEMNFNYIFGNNLDNESFELKELVKKHSFDFIIIGNYSTPIERKLISFLKRKKIPYIISSDGGFIKKESFIKKIIKRYYLSNAEAYYSSSVITDEYLLHYGAKKDNIYRYPFTSILSNEIVTSDCLMERYKNKNQDFTIIGIGQIVPRKGWDLLIKSSTLFHSNIKIKIIGGFASDELISLIKNLNIKNIEFIDFSNKKLVENYYKQSDLFVLPTREDIWGLVINEAMAYGVPIITTNKCMAGLEIIKNDFNGYILDINDEKQFVIDLAKLINSLHSDKEKLERISINSIETAKKYTIEKMAEAYYDALELIGKKRN